MVLSCQDVKSALAGGKKSSVLIKKKILTSHGALNHLYSKFDKGIVSK